MNYGVTVMMLRVVLVAQLAALFGIVAGTLFNFVASRYWVFRPRRLKTIEGQHDASL